MTTTALPRSFTLTLAVIVALGSFAIDMYLASLPAIVDDFGAPASLIQWTLTGYLLVLGAGQLIAGPITDAVGRRRPLLVGLVLFTAGSLLAAAAPTAWALVIARILQAAGGAVAVVVANSSVRDRAQGDTATRLYALLLMISAVAPVMAPSVGGVIEDFLGWRSVFIALTGVGIVAMLATARSLPESLDVADRVPLRFGNVFRGYTTALAAGSFVRPLAAFSAVSMFGFAYVGGASYVYQGPYELGASEFGLLFGVTAAMMGLGSIAAHRLTGRISQGRLALLGVAFIVIGALAAVIAVHFALPVTALAAAIGVAMSGAGLAEPVLMGVAMSSRDNNLGSASALLGGSQFVLGAIASAVAAPAATAGPLVWTGLLLAMALLVALLTAGVAASTTDQQPLKL